MSDNVNIREFRERLAKETKGRGVEARTMENFERYRREKRGKSATQRESFETMKKEFGEMKVNMVAARRAK